MPETSATSQTINLTLLGEKLDAFEALSTELTEAGSGVLPGGPMLSSLESTLQALREALKTAYDRPRSSPLAVVSEVKPGYVVSSEDFAIGHFWKFGRGEKADVLIGSPLEERPDAENCDRGRWRFVVTRLSEIITPPHAFAQRAHYHKDRWVLDPDSEEIRFDVRSLTGKVVHYWGTAEIS